MPFPENIKLEDRRRSNCKCVICQQPFVDVHHIIPEADGGPNDLDNAAPLCASCHNWFGANPVLQKQIREMRDLWWEFCEKAKANPDLVAINEKLDAIQGQIKQGQNAGTKLRGEWSPNAINSFNEMWLITMGANRGTYVYIHPTPTKGNPPWIGAPYWIQLPQGGGNVWL